MPSQVDDRAAQLASLSDIEMSAQVGEKLHGLWCRCWFSDNTGPQGQCLKCGKRRLQFAEKLSHCRMAENMLVEKELHTKYVAELIYQVNHMPKDISVFSDPNDRILEDYFFAITATPRQRCVAMLLLLEKEEG